MSTAAIATARRTPLALYFGVSITLPRRIAELLPAAAVPPHITLLHAQVSPWELWRLRDAFEGRSPSPTLAGLTRFRIRLEGVGDFRTDKEKPTPVVFLQVTEGRRELARLAAALDFEFRLQRRRRFRYHPHATLAWRDRNLPKAEGDAQLDRIKAAYNGFRAEFPVEAVAYTQAHGTILTPRVLTWGTPRLHSIR